MTLGIGFILVALALLPRPARERLNAACRDALAPFMAFVADATRASRNVLQGAGEVMDENVRMTLEVGRLRNEVRRLEVLAHENRELRRQIGFLESTNYRLIPCEVIARDLASWWQTVRIDRGRAHGIAPDRPVLTVEGLVGRVVAVSEFTSDVLLLADPGCQVSARLARLESSFGIVRGSGTTLGGEPMCRMTFVSKELNILLGDEVVTSGLGQVYPRGLRIGTVRHIFMDRSGLFQYVDVAPVAELHRLRFVYVVDRDIAASASGFAGERP